MYIIVFSAKDIYQKNNNNKKNSKQTKPEAKAEQCVCTLMQPIVLYLIHVHGRVKMPGLPVQIVQGRVSAVNSEIPLFSSLRRPLLEF